jgi:hypothetical protein
MADIQSSAERMVCPYLQPTGVASAANSSNNQADCGQSACPVHGSLANRHRHSASVQQPTTGTSASSSSSSAARSSVVLVDAHPITQTVELLFECKACGKRFQHRSSLSTHFRSHSGLFCFMPISCSCLIC